MQKSDKWLQDKIEKGAVLEKLSADDKKAIIETFNTNRRF